jgi:hypothetical protein
MPTPRFREAGFGVQRGQIVDLSGNCPGFAAMPLFRNGPVNRDGTLAKVTRARDAEIERRAAAARRSAAGSTLHWGRVTQSCPAALNERGVLTPAERGRWGATQISRVLTRPAG